MKKFVNKIKQLWKFYIINDDFQCCDNCQLNGDCICCTGCPNLIPDSELKKS